ncbi:MAG: sigma-70 family RNA polymerase sigma factor [Bacteroidota bacterium]
MSKPPVTVLLKAWREGETDAFDQLLPLVYDELKRIASRHLQRERSDHTLHTTALVHEAYLKLLGSNQVDWQNRAHFLAVAAQAMRHVLVSYARRHNAQKRGGPDRYKLSLSDAEPLANVRADSLLALDEALTRLAKLNPRLSQAVELRFFGGLSLDELAHVAERSPATVKRDLIKARAWLHRELHD